MAKQTLQEEYEELAIKCTDLARSVSKDEHSVIARGGVATSDAGRALAAARASKLKVTLAIDKEKLDARKPPRPVPVPEKKKRGRK